MTAITFPVGRMVWGSVYQAQTQDYDGKPLTVKTGPQAGQPTQRYSFGVAIPKGNERHWAETPWGQTIWAEGHASFRNNEPQRHDFAWKVTDGDSTTPNKRGTRPCDQTGYPRHWVVAFSSSFPPKLYNADGTQVLTEPNAIKTGFYIQVHGSVSGNGNIGNPGVYMNHELVALAGYGEEIHNGADPKSVGFGQSPLPAGASATPVGGFSPAQGGYQQPQGPQGGYTPPPPGGAPAQGGYPQQPPQGPQGGYTPPPPGGAPAHGGYPQQSPQPYPQGPQGGYAPPPGGYAPPPGGAPAQGGYQQPQGPQGGYTPPPPGGAPAHGNYAPPPGGNPNQPAPQGGYAQYAPPGVQPMPNFLNGPQR